MKTNEDNFKIFTIIQESFELWLREPDVKKISFAHTLYFSSALAHDNDIVLDKNYKVHI